MRHYPANSAKAAARILAMALLADGAIDPSELRTLERFGTLRRLGISEDEFDETIHELCEDLLAFAHRSHGGNLEVEGDALRAVLGDVSLPYLQRKLLRAVVQIVNADGRLAGGEAVLVTHASEVWGLEPFDALRSRPSPGRRWPPRVLQARLA